MLSGRDASIDDELILTEDALGEVLVLRGHNLTRLETIPRVADILCSQLVHALRV